VIGALRRAAAAGFGVAWEARRRAYALGLARPRRVAARVVSVGNLTVGGTGKTTLTLHLAAEAARRGLDPAVVCRRYHPGPGGFGDEEALYRERLGESMVFAGSGKRALAARAAAAGRRLVLVDDGFSHWDWSATSTWCCWMPAIHGGAGDCCPTGGCASRAARCSVRAWW